MPIYRCSKFRWKISKIKYAISDRPHWRQLDLCETSFLLLITEKIALELKILTDIKIRFKKN
jgi:hypothetical protein